MCYLSKQTIRAGDNEASKLGPQSSFLPSFPTFTAHSLSTSLWNSHVEGHSS